MQPGSQPPSAAEDELSGVYARLSGVLLSAETIQTALKLITSLARDTLPGSLGSGVTLLRGDGRPGTSASTDESVEILDRLQYGLEQGPCLTAWADSTVVTSNDLATERRWPLWCAQAGTLGVRSVLSAPLEVGSTSWGAMKVYSASADAYDERAEDILHRFAAQAAIFVSNVHTAQSAERINNEFKDTMRARDTIATATGMVMAWKGLDYHRAYRQLIMLARSAHLPLRELAERITASPSTVNTIPRPMTNSDSRRFLAAYEAADLTVANLWLRYVALGGEASEMEVDAYLNGAIALPAIQHDMLAHAINERLDEIAPPQAPYSEDFMPTDYLVNFFKGGDGDDPK